MKKKGKQSSINLNKKEFLLTKNLNMIGLVRTSEVRKRIEILLKSTQLLQMAIKISD